MTLVTKVALIVALITSNACSSATDDFYGELRAPAGMEPMGTAKDEFGVTVAWFSPQDPEATPPKSLIGTGILPPRYRLAPEIPADVNEDLVECVVTPTGHSMDDIVADGLFVDYSCSGWPWRGEPAGVAASADYTADSGSGPCSVWARIGDPAELLRGVTSNAPWILTIALFRGPQGDLCE